MIFFIGIKGTGMAALACMLKDLGNEVAGSDLSRHFFTQDQLELKNIPIHDFASTNILDNMTVIIGNAFDDDFCEVATALANPTIKSYRYHQYLGKLLENYQSYAVAGSHGKTTTTAMLSTMFNHFEDCGYLIGDGTGYLPPQAKRLVIEACEFRRHFLSYYPDFAIITNVEIDHVDYFNNEQDYRHAFEEFAMNVKNKVIMFGDDGEVRKLAISENKKFYFGFEIDNDLYAFNIDQQASQVDFDVKINNQYFGHFQLPLVGKHLVADTLACIAMGWLSGMSAANIQKGLSDFQGAKRRYVISTIGENIFIDDYAHHPTEIKVTINATKTRYPNHKIVAIFKPHRASRLVSFVQAFEDALKLADVSGVCEFTSIDDFDDTTVTSVDYLTKRIPGCRVFVESFEDAKYLASLAPAVFLFMSSKDIYGFADLVKECLINRN